MRAILLLLIALPCFSANHYIRVGAGGSANGSDWTNACTWFTGSCAPSAMVRGDTYYVASGTYANANVNFNKATSGTTVITIKKATVADHGTATGWSDAYGTGPANIVQDSSQNNIIYFTTSYWVFDGVTGGGPGNWKTGFGFYIDATRVSNPSPGPGTDDGVTDVTMSHFEVEGDGDDGDGSGSQANDGFSAGRGSRINISYAYIHHTGRCSLFWRASDSIISYSWFEHDESTAGEHAEGASIWSGTCPANTSISANCVSNVTFAFDVWEDMEGTGTIVYEGDDLKVYGNIFVGIGGAGMGNGVVTTWSASQATNVKVYNCSFLDSGFGVNFPDSASTGNVAYNNIFVNNDPGYDNVATHNYNWYYNSGGTFGEANAQTGTGNPFVSSATGNFHLLAATTAGTSFSSPYNVDPDGITRASDGTWDRGAFEFNAGGGSTQPRFTSGNTRSSGTVHQ